MWNVIMGAGSTGARPTLLRWTDFLTGRTCTLRVEDSDADAPLGSLVSKYLTGADPDALPDMLVKRRLILPDAAAALAAIQDLTHTLTDEGALGGLAPGSVFKLGVRELSSRETVPVSRARVQGAEVGLLDVTIDRSETDYCRNWIGFHRRRWSRGESKFLEFVARAAHEGGDDADSVLSLGDHASRMEFLRRMARAIWDSPFENYSRFTGEALRYKTGDESLASIIEGRGAICSEKVQALKFVTDAFGFESQYLFAGPDATGRLPVKRLRHILDTFDFRGAAPAMRYWQHMALEYTVDGERALVDATNGNIPFLFERGSAVDDALGSERPRPFPVQMGVYPEDFYYHRAPDDLALDLCYAMENFIPEIDLVQVFDNELGLVITPDFLVTPLPYTDTEGYEGIRRLYERMAQTGGLKMDASAEWRMDGDVWTRFREREPDAVEPVLGCYEHLVERYNAFEDERHEMGLAVIGLKRRLRRDG